MDIAWIRQPGEEQWIESKKWTYIFEVLVNTGAGAVEDIDKAFKAKNLGCLVFKVSWREYRIPKIATLIREEFRYWSQDGVTVVRRCDFSSYHSYYVE